MEILILFKAYTHEVDVSHPHTPLHVNLLTLTANIQSVALEEYDK